GVDKNIDETYDKGGELLDSFDIDKLDMDDPAVAARYAHYQGIVNNSTEDMSENVLNYPKHMRELRKASRELATDMKTGVLGRAQEQFDDFNSINENIKKRTDISQETKDLYSDYLLSQYKGLNYNQKTGEFNKIKDGEINLKSGILDTEKFISELGRSFEFHSEGGGGARVGTLKGLDGEVIITSTTNKSTRSAKRVEEATKLALEEKDYKGEREQYHMMQQATGNATPASYIDGELATPEELAKMDEQNLIDRAVLELTGKKGHTNSSVKSLDSVKGRGASSGEDNPYAEVRNNLGNKEDKDRVAGDNTKVNVLAKGEKLPGYASAQDLINKASYPSVDGKGFYEGFAALKEQGVFTSVAEYTDWINLNHKATSEGKIVDNSLLEMYNSADQNQKVEIYERNSSNEREKLPFTSPSELLEHNQNVDNKYVWVEVTGSVKDALPTYSRNAAGNIISKDGTEVKKGGKPVKNPSNLPQFSTTVPEIKYNSTPTYSTSGNVFKAKRGELKEFNNTVLDTRGKVSENLELIQTSQFLKIDKESGAYTTQSVDIVSDPSRFPKK
ncbi:MAG: hypothetical protein KAU20_00225, partial [Nanoarchaeota archaeon]|nr:hypothetical protein [Nanoarchaeota archaeon]